MNATSTAPAAVAAADALHQDPEVAALVDRERVRQIEGAPHPAQAAARRLPLKKEVALAVRWSRQHSSQIGLHSLGCMVRTRTAPAIQIAPSRVVARATHFLKITRRGHDHDHSLRDRY